MKPKRCERMAKSSGGPLSFQTPFRLWFPNSKSGRKGLSTRWNSRTMFVRIFECNQTKIAPHKELHGVPCSQETVHRRNQAFLRCEFLKDRESGGGCISAFLNNKELEGRNFAMGF